MFIKTTQLNTVLVCFRHLHNFLYIQNIELLNDVYCMSTLLSVIEITALCSLLANFTCYNMQVHESLINSLLASKRCHSNS